MLRIFLVVGFLVCAVNIFAANEVVEKVVDANSLLLVDGRTVELIGVSFLEQDPNGKTVEVSNAYVKRLVEGKRIMLNFIKPHTIGNNLVTNNIFDNLCCFFNSRFDYR